MRRTRKHEKFESDHGIPWDKLSRIPASAPMESRCRKWWKQRFPSFSMNRSPFRADSRTDTGYTQKNTALPCRRKSSCQSATLSVVPAGYLPEDISIYRGEEMPADFHARFSCKAKEYMYRIHNAKARIPLQQIWNCSIAASWTFL